MVSGAAEVGVVGSGSARRSACGRTAASSIPRASLPWPSERATTYVAGSRASIPTPVDYRHCWVTDVPWSEDGVAVWEAGDILFAAGHNLLEQAPGLGRGLAEAALGEQLADELRPN